MDNKPKTNIDQPPIQKDTLDRGKLITKAGGIGVILNLTMAAIKVVIGILSNSVAIVSDAINNLTDSVSSLVTIIGYKLGDMHPTKKHPLGYGRLEYISSLVISSLILFGGFEFLQVSFKRILSPENLIFNKIQVVVLIFTVFLKIWLSRYNISIGSKSNSEALIASGKDAMMDVLITSATIISMLVFQFTGLLIDGYIGLLISIFIIYSGISLIKETLNSLLGERPEKQLVLQLYNEILKYKDVFGAYDLMLHSYGPGIQYGSVDLELPDYMTVDEAHKIMEKAHDEILKKYNIYFTFGLYSVNTYDDKINYLRLQIKELLEDIPGVINIHGFNFDEASNFIRFDVVVDFTIHNYKKFKLELTNTLVEAYPNYKFDLNIDPDYA